MQTITIVLQRVDMKFQVFHLLQFTISRFVDLKSTKKLTQKLNDNITAYWYEIFSQLYHSIELINPGKRGRKFKSNRRAHITERLCTFLVKCSQMYATEHRWW